MGRKRNPYIQLFTRDILSSPRCRALSESAAGVYFFLLCRLNEPPTPGAYRISDWELHPTWKRSCTQQCLATTDKQARLQYFAKMLSKNDLPWKQATILGGLQELYKYGIITVDGDMLVQPRMYKDNGFDLPDLGNEGDPAGTILDDPVSGSMALRGDDDFNENKGANKGAVLGTQNGTENEPKKEPVSHARARAQLRDEIMSNNIDNIGNIGGAGDEAPCVEPMQKPCKNEDDVKTAKNDLDDKKESSPTFEEFWDAYDKKRDRTVSEKLWGALPQKDKEAIMAYIPLYKEAQPTKRFRKDPTTFLRHRSWEDEIIREDEPGKGRGATQPPPKAGDPAPATKPAPNKYKKW